MKRILICCCLLVLIFAVYLELKEDSVSKTVNENYTIENGSIKNYGRTEEISVLSESIGQYMEYLLLVKDGKQFHTQMELLQEHFLVEKNDAVFIKWQLEEHTSTNAAVDDLRIIKVLKQASHTFEDPEYGILADKLEKSLLLYQSEDGVLTDFFDWKMHEKSPLIHLSYIDMDAFKDIAEIDQDFYRDLLKNAALKETPFFKEIWHTEEKNYGEADPNEVNLIDQLLIAGQYVKGKEKIPENFDEWIKKEWDTKGKLFGKYQKSSALPSVSYESSAVYALAVQYFMLTEQEQYAAELQKELLKQLPFTEHDSFSTIHFFDYILAQISAESFEQKGKK